VQAGNIASYEYPTGLMKESPHTFHYAHLPPHRGCQPGQVTHRLFPRMHIVRKPPLPRGTNTVYLGMPFCNRPRAWAVDVRQKILRRKALGIVDMACTQKAGLDKAWQTLPN
jgi:hypothetical protein